MPSLHTPPFPSLIQSIPVRDHSIEVNAAFWQNKFEQAEQNQLWTAIFGNASSIRLTRDRLLFYPFEDEAQKCAEILLWGYPTDKHGLASNLLAAASLQRIAACAQSPGSWQQYRNNFVPVENIAISTITKLAYFHRIVFANCQALIFDQRVTHATSRWAELIIPELRPQYQYSAERHYVTYLKKMQHAANSICCEVDQIELFLFALGRGL
jgi:hypothetical protein